MESPASLPDSTRIGAVRLQVSDLARSLAFYESVLGFAVHEQHPGRAWMGAPGGASILELVERPEARPAPRRGLLGLFHVAYLMPDRAALGRFLSHLASSGVPVGASDHIVSEALYLTDPDGLGIEVYADRPRDSWQWRGSELAMATEPLDTEGVVRAGGGAPWTGAPAGTTVGHVHLHVGDLAEAERFYHTRLGLEPTARGYPGALFLSAGGYHHHLGVNIWAAGAPPAGDDDARLLDWELRLPSAGDADAAAERLASSGYFVERAGPGWLAADPWGTRLRLTG